MTGAAGHDSGARRGGTWLCPTELDRVRFLEMGDRNARHRVSLLVVIAGVLLASMDLLGMPAVAVAIALLATMPLSERAAVSSPAPEYWIAAHWACLMFAGAASVATTGGVHSPVLLWSVIFVPSLASRFPSRVVVGGAAVVLVSFTAAAFVADAGVAMRDPTPLFFMIGVVTVVAAVTITMSSSDRAYRVEAVIDPLTGLLNRASLDQRFDELSAQARLTGGGICMILCDIDHFKQINDRHGHDHGDAVLREVAETVRLSLRQFELAYRIGGEEFLILLPGVGLEHAVEVAGRIRQRVATARPAELDVTVSCGVAAAASGGIDFEAMFRAADGALYEAKHQGRNRVVAASAVTMPLQRRLAVDRRLA